MGCFGTTKHMPPFDISYMYQNGERVSLSMRDGYAFFKFSDRLKRDINSSLLDAYKIYFENQSMESADFVTKFNNRLHLKSEIKGHFTELAAKIFGSEEDIIYIPAGRSLLSVLSDQLDVKNTNYENTVWHKIGQCGGRLSKNSTGTDKKYRYRYSKGTYQKYFKSRLC